MRCTTSCCSSRDADKANTPAHSRLTNYSNISARIRVLTTISLEKCYVSCSYHGLFSKRFYLWNLNKSVWQLSLIQVVIHRIEWCMWCELGKWCPNVGNKTDDASCEKMDWGRNPEWINITDPGNVHVSKYCSNLWVSHTKVFHGSVLDYGGSRNASRLPTTNQVCETSDLRLWKYTSPRGGSLRT